MQTIRLPKRFDTLNRDELHILNQQLRQGEVRLDWGNVEPGIVPEVLQALFKDLSLADAIDDIGGDTIPEALFPEIQAAFLHNEAGDASTPLLVASEIAEPKTPALWVPKPLGSDTSPFLEQQIVGEDMGSGKHGHVIEGMFTNESEQEQIAETHTESAVQERKGTYVQSTPVLEAPPPSQLRDQLEEMVLRDLLGPVGGEDEELNAEVARVRDRYLIGMLAPHKLQTLPEEQDELGIAEEGPLNDETADVGVAQKASLNPSSLGMSFSVDKDATELLVTVRWGQYQRRDSETQMKKTGSLEKIWKRVPRGGEPKRISLRVGASALWRPEEDEQPDVIVKGLVRDSGSSWTVTLFLVNGQDEPKRLRDTVWLFQPEMIVWCAHLSTARDRTTKALHQ